jgi:hypothetical protein
MATTELLNLQLSAFWLEGPWRLELNKLGIDDKKGLLKSFGIDPNFFAVRQYQQAQVADTWELLQQRNLAVQKSIEELYNMLGWNTERQYTLST